MGRFVPLKVTSTGDEWQQWARQFKYEGKGIPIIYIVRADGEQLYGKSGSLKGDDLLELLNSASQQSGRILNEAEFNLLESCNLEAESALEAGELATAAQSLARIAKIGELGNLQSFSAPAMKADQLTQQISEKVLETLTSEIDAKLKDPELVFEGVVELTHAQEVFADFPGVKPATDQLFKSVKKDKAYRDYLKPAKALVKARMVAMSPKPYDKKRAEKAYGNIISRYGETPAGELARTELGALNPKSEGLSDDFVASDADAEAEVNSGSKMDAETKIDTETEMDDKETVRDWVSANGKHTIKATLIELNGGKVKLKKPDGSEVEVSLDQLDQTAKDYLDSRKK